MQTDKVVSQSLVKAFQEALQATQESPNTTQPAVTKSATKNQLETMESLIGNIKI